MLRTPASCWNKERLDVFEVKIEEVKKAGSHLKTSNVFIPM